MIHVIAILTAKTGQRAAVLEAFLANVPAVLAEPGCIEYAAVVDFAPRLPFQNDLGPDSFAVVEKWESAAALETHLDAPHMAAYHEKVAHLMAGRAIHVLSPA